MLRSLASWALALPKTAGASTVRYSSTAASRPAPPPLSMLQFLRAESVSTPQDFLKAISRPRRDLASNSACVQAVGEDWNSMFTLTSEKLKGAGVEAKDRKYLLWSLEKARQGLHPNDFAYDIKKKKKVRGWGPRVQKGYRVRGELRPGEKRA